MKQLIGIVALLLLAFTSSAQLNLVLQGETSLTHSAGGVAIGPAYVTNDVQIGVLGGNWNSEAFGEAYVAIGFTEGAAWNPFLGYAYGRVGNGTGYNKVFVQFQNERSTLRFYMRSVIGGGGIDSKENSIIEGNDQLYIGASYGFLLFPTK